MALRIAGLPVLGPSDLAAAFRSVLGWTDEAVQVVADLPARVAALVDEAERLVDRAAATLDQAAATLDRAAATLDQAATTLDQAATTLDQAATTLDRTATTLDRAEDAVGSVETVAEDAAATVARARELADGADQLVGRIAPVTGAAEAVLESVGATGAEAHALLETFRPITERGAPLLQHFVDEFSVHELQALIRLIDGVPQFAAHMEADVMPVLAKLDQVGPDVHELLDVLKDVRLAIQGVPGFALFRRRGADKDDELADDRPATPPPVGRG